MDHISKGLGNNVVQPKQVDKPINANNAALLGKKKDKAKVEAKARYLADKFNNPDYYKFYCKIAYALDFGTIDRLVGQSFEKATSNPAAYFSRAAKGEMGE